MTHHDINFICVKNKHIAQGLCIEMVLGLSLN